MKEQIEQTIRASQQAAADAAKNAQPALAPVPPWHNDNDMPMGVQKVTIAFFVTCAIMVIGLPLARAIGRWIDRRPADSSGQGLNSQAEQQLQHIAQAVDAMSIEVERISESQRFMAKLQSGASAEEVRR